MFEASNGSHADRLTNPRSRVSYKSRLFVGKTTLQVANPFRSDENSMQNFDINQILGLSGTTLPISILLIENDEDRQFLTELYLQYRPLMYKIAFQFF